MIRMYSNIIKIAVHDGHSLCVYTYNVTFKSKKLQNKSKNFSNWRIKRHKPSVVVVDTSYSRHYKITSGPQELGLVNRVLRSTGFSIKKWWDMFVWTKQTTKMTSCPRALSSAEVRWGVIKFPLCKVSAGRKTEKSIRPLWASVRRREVLGLLLTLNTLGDFPHYSAVLYPKSYRIRKRAELRLCWMGWH